MEKIKKLYKIFWVFFKIGSFTFGGGLAMLPLIQKEVVDNQNWVTEEEVLDIFAISQSVPGVIAINSAFFIGNKVMGFTGAAAAAMGVILPAFLSILLIISVLKVLRDNIYVEKVFAGIRAASAALILLAAITLSKTGIKGKSGYIIAILSFAAIVFLDIHAMWVIIFGGLTGYIIFLSSRRKS